MSKKYESLSKSPVFEGILPGAIEPLLRDLGTREQAYAKGDVICKVGASLDAFPVVLEGRVRASLVRGQKRQAIAWFEPGDSFAEAVPVSLKRSPVEIAATKKTTVLFIPAEALKRQLSADGYRLNANLMLEMSKKVSGLSEKLGLLGETKLSDRVLRYLDTLPTSDDGWITIPLKYNELAEYLGVNNTSLSRTMHAMEDEGLLKMDGRKIFLLDAASAEL